MKPLHQFKNIYNPYKGDYGKDQKSLKGPDEINDSVKPIDREDANIEAEKDEIILKPDLSGIYKIGGKSHSKGGTPLLADPGVGSSQYNLAMTFKKHHGFHKKK